MKKDYSEYDVMDFLNNSSFIQWVRHEDEENDARWERWMEAHPEKLNVVEQAKEYYKQLLSFDKHKAEEGTAEDVWRGVEAKIYERDKRGQMRVLKVVRWSVAACIIIFAGVWIVHSKLNAVKKEFVVIQSGKEQKRVVLPDSSEIFMNSFTTLKYCEGDERECWLDGQAFFKIEHRVENGNKVKPFIVHAGIETITVLGTSFTVKNVDSAARVVLVTGKIKASIGDKTVVMRPGEKTTWKANGFYSEQVDPQLYLAWKNGKFSFHHTSLKEIKQLVKDIYGYDLVIKNERRIKLKTISGNIDAGDENVLWNALGVMFNGKVERREKQVVLTIND